MPKSFLNTKHIAFIKKNRFTMSGKDMAKHFGCSHSVVQRYMRVNNLQVSKELQRKFASDKLIGRTTFTKEQETFILANYLTMPIKSIGEKIGRSFTGIMGRLNQLRLTIPEEIRAQRKAAGMYRKGAVPNNKGRKMVEWMSAENIKKSAATRFKKGQLPHNAKGIKNGDIRIRHGHEFRGTPPYKWIRISLGKWKALHVHLWEKKYGPVPNGHCVVFKNGNTMDCTLKNLECITRKKHAENTRESDGYIARTLSYVKGGKLKADPELVREILQNKPLLELKRNQLRLKRTIDAKQKIS